MLPNLPFHAPFIVITSHLFVKKWGWGKIMYDGVKNISFPEWAIDDAKIFDGLDLLGLRNVAQTISNHCLNGITTISPQVRYLGIRSWFIHLYEKCGLADSYSPFLDFCSKIESAVAIGSILYKPNIVGVVGSTLAKEIIAESDNQINIKQGFIDDVKDKYDMIVLKHVFEHLSNPIKNLKKLHSHINKYLFIEVPGIIKRISSIQNAHNFYFTENTLHKIITKTGFKIVSSRYCNETEFIYALYEKSHEKNIDFNYSYLNEVKKIKKIYKNDIIRINITKIIKSTGLYNLLLPIRKIILKILNLR